MKKNFLYGNTSKSIIGGLYEVARKGKGLSEDALKNALMIELRKRGHQINTDVLVTHRYDNKKIGEGVIDMVVNNKIALSIKKLKKIRNKDKETLRSLMESGRYAVGLVLNFNPNKPQAKRVDLPQFAPKS